MLDILIFLLALCIPFLLTAYAAADVLLPAIERRWGSKVALRIAFALPVILLLSYHGVLFEAIWQLKQGITLDHSTQAIAATSGLFGVIPYLRKVRKRYRNNPRPS